jgi:hypothetical protein
MSARGAGPAPEPYVAGTRREDIRMAIGSSCEGGERRETLQFLWDGGRIEPQPLTAEFCAGIGAPDGGPLLCVRDGTVGGAESCFVPRAGVAEYLRAQRPGLFSGAEALPGGGSCADEPPAPDAAREAARSRLAEAVRLMRESMTPEQIAGIEAFKAREREMDAGGADIEAVFERLERRQRAVPGARFGRPPAMRPAADVPSRRTDQADYEVYIAETWSRALRMRIEPGACAADGTEREIIRFINPETGRGPVTGHESYYVDENLCAMLANPEERRLRPRWYLCAGTAGRWHACHVDHTAVEDYLREKRPWLFPAAEPAPGGMPPPG